MRNKIFQAKDRHEYLFYAIILFTIIFVLWAYIAEIDQVVRAEAVVEPVGKVQLVQSRYPGVISFSGISVGDKVKLNQVLIRLDAKQSQEVFNYAVKRIALLKKEQKIYERLIKAGAEPRIKLLEIQHRILNAEVERNRAALQIKFSEIKAPIKGILTAVNFFGPGAVIEEGDILAEVVPEEEYFLLKAKVLPKDISKLSVGQDSRVSFTAYDFSRYGIMDGVVVQIAQNTTKTKEGDIFYDAWIKTKNLRFSKSDIIPKILPGMMARVDMLGEKRTVLDYLLSPLKQVSYRALTES